MMSDFTVWMYSIARWGSDCQYRRSVTTFRLSLMRDLRDMSQRSFDYMKAYTSVSAKLIEEGYEDLLDGGPSGVREALAQMMGDAEQMMMRAAALKAQLDAADAQMADS